MSTCTLICPLFEAILDWWFLILPGLSIAIAFLGDSQDFLEQLLKLPTVMLRVWGALFVVWLMQVGLVLGSSPIIYSKHLPGPFSTLLLLSSIALIILFKRKMIEAKM